MKRDPTLQRIWSSTPTSTRYSFAGEPAISIKRNGRMKIVRLTELAPSEIEALLADGEKSK
jgi:hypothetical protein